MSTIPTTTRHFYHLEEIKSFIQKANREGDEERMVFGIVELDLSGLGNAAWNVLFQCLVEESCFPEAGLILSISMLYRSWTDVVKKDCANKASDSHKNLRARTYLIIAATLIARANKCRLVSNASVVSLVSPIKPLEDMIKTMESQQDSDEQGFEIHESLVDQVQSFIERVTDMQGKSEDARQLSTRTVTPLFAYYLENTTEAWNRYYASLSKESDPFDSKSTTTSLSEDAEENKSETTTDSDSLKQKALDMEKMLLLLAHMIYEMDATEDRNVPYVSDKESKQDKKSQNLASSTASNAFVHRAIVNLHESWIKIIPKISGNCKAFFQRVLVQYWSLVVETAMSIINDNSLVIVLLAIMELSANNLGKDRSQFLTSILLTVRHAGLSFQVNKINVDVIKEDDTVKRGLALYEAYPSDESLDAEKLSKRRMYTMEVKYVDRDTMRGSGRSNLELLKQYAKNKSFDLAQWGNEEIAKSHGLGWIFKDPKKKRQTPAKQASSSQDSVSIIGAPAVQMDCTMNEFYFDVTTVLKQDLIKYQDDYTDDAKKTLLEEEREHGSKDATLSRMSKRLYRNQWILSTVLAEPVPEESIVHTAKKKKTSKKEAEKMLEKTQAKSLMEIDSGKPSAKSSKPVKKKEEQVKQPMDKKKKKDTVKDDSPKKKKKTSSREQVRDDDNKDENASSKKRSKKRAREEEDSNSDSDVPSKKRPRTEERVKKPTTRKKNVNKRIDFDVSKLLDWTVVKSEEEWEKIGQAPVFQKPSSVSKKFLHIYKDKIYKGPYDVDMSRDYESIVRILYRTRVLQAIFKKKTDLVQEPKIVASKDKTKVYLVYEYPGRVPPSSSDLKDHVEYDYIKTHKKKIAVLDRVYSNLCDVSKWIELRRFDHLVGPSIEALLACYLLGIGDAQLKKLLTRDNSHESTEDASKKSKDEPIYLLELEDNRETLPVYKYEKSLEEKQNKVTILDILFTKKPKEVSRIIALLPLIQSRLEKWVQRVKELDASSLLDHDWCKQMHYDCAISAQEWKDRLQTMISCVANLSYHVKHGHLDGQTRTLKRNVAHDDQDSIDDDEESHVNKDDEEMDESNEEEEAPVKKTNKNTAKKQAPLKKETESKKRQDSSDEHGVESEDEDFDPMQEEDASIKSDEEEEEDD